MPFYDDFEEDNNRSDNYRGGGGDGGYRDRGPRRHQPPLHTEKIITDRKVFFLDLKENERGRVLKITEDVRGRRDTIMVPVECIRDFIESLQRIEEVAGGGEVERHDDDYGREEVD